MNPARSDAIVFYGATGDLAYKQIYPALYALAKHDRLDIPVIGVAKAGWELPSLQARARDSVLAHGPIDETVFARFESLLRYVGGDYRDAATFTALRRELGDARRPLHYLAIPPELFPTIVDHLAGSDCDVGARIGVAQPYGHPTTSLEQHTRRKRADHDERELRRRRPRKLLRRRRRDPRRHPEPHAPSRRAARHGAANRQRIRRGPRCQGARTAGSETS